MADNVILPPSGTGDVNPKASTQQVTADSSHVQDVQIADVSGGVRTRVAMGTVIGAVTETAPGTDTASSGLNGRLQRIAQRLTSLISALGSPFQAGGSIGNTTFASTQSGTWTVQPGNTANTTAWKVDNSAVTQPVSGTVSITDISNAEYETVAASQTAQALGATGATGDYISGILVVPATTAPGNVLLLDNTTSITVFTGGTGSVTSLVPFFIPLGIKSVSGAWKLTTGANVSCIGMGNFT